MTKKNIIFFTCTGAFVLLNSLAIMKEILIFPFISLFLVLLYLLIFRVDWLLYLMAFITPLSVSFEDTKVQLSLSMPSEIIMIMVSLLFICRILYDLVLDRKLLTHPVSIVIYLYLFWIFFTAITSELPVVSFKYLISRLWFIIPCYFVLIQMVKKGALNFVAFFNCYAVGLALVVLITTVRHASYGFSEFAGHWIMSPFYNDHTAYGAILAFMLPIAVGFFFLPKNSKWEKIFYLCLIVIFTAGLYISYSRAAWLSMIAGIGVWAILKLRIRFSWVIMIAAVLGAAFYFYADDILYKMSRNSQDSSGNLVEHIQSMSNITTDASNVERLNRWVAAQGMIEERPVFGWGPGTYQFVYAPFQKGKYKTIISTNFGDGGNAHSEYISAFAEMGIVGFAIFLTMVCMIIYYGIITYIRAKDKSVRIISLSTLVALITYFIHAVMNNFLDTDKLALPVWAAFAVIVFLNTYGKIEQGKNEVMR